MRIYLETYGCTANKSDESIIKGILTKEHHTIVTDSTQADIFILLTCTVIDTTEQRMLSRLKTFQKTNKPIIVTGCMIPLQQKTITTLIPNARVLPPHYIHHINEILQQKEPEFIQRNKTMLPKQFTGTIAPIAIAEGCLQNCSYCITQFTRGTLHSYPREEILSDIKNAQHQGCKEIQLTAQDTASYGLDTGDNLGNLIKDVTGLPGEFRVRIGMMNPYTLKKNLDTILPVYNAPKLYAFLHLPIQSGDDDILQKMNRKYTVNEYLTLVDQFRRNHLTLTLATDIIIGFPTENDTQFNNTITLIKNIQPDITNITRYSARPFTTAKTMKGRIPTEIVKQRSTQITHLCRTISTRKNKEHIGKHYTILITEHGKKNTMMGRAENYKPVIINEQLPLGTLAPVEITSSAPTHLFGKLI
ncbi:MAG: tRNA (N(6)-L-threonylcarbamoyladenosine(37)-C(2))-methylthiotransferase [Methanobacteriota archaeon]